MLIIFAGLPGTGKSSIAKELARRTGATYLRIDQIEQAISRSGRRVHPVQDAGYLVGYALAEENIRIGRTVIADSVNPVRMTRDAWLSVAERTGCRAVEVEVVCSDLEQHRKRIEERTTDIPGLTVPSWQEVLDREYESWDRDHLLVDTSAKTVQQCVDELMTSL